MGTRFLEDEVIRLRALEPEDLELLYRWENDSALWEFSSTLAPFSRYLLKEYIENAAQQTIFEARQLRLMMTLKPEQKTIGVLDLFDFDPHNRRAACGILVDRPYQGNGYGFRSMCLLTDYAFSFLGMRQLYVHIPAHNVDSLRLYERFGFERTGILRDWVVTDNRRYADVYVLQLINSGKDL